MRDGNFLVRGNIEISMNTKKTEKKSVSLYGTIAAISCFFLLTVFSEDISDGVKKGTDMCVNILIPSLFLMLCTSSFFISCGLPAGIKSRLDSPLNKLFGLSGNTAELILSGLTGGYNIASKGAVQLVEKNRITKNEAQRIAMFFSAPGISFCINVAGNSIYHSKAAGLRFFISSISGSILCAFIYRLFRKGDTGRLIQRESPSLSRALTESVENASAVILNICARVTLYYGISPVITALTGRGIVSELMSLLGEVTSGISYSAKNFSLEISAFVISFGGICILLQQLPDIMKLGINPLIFLTSRLAVSTVSSIIFSLSLLIFPLNAAVFSQQPEIHIFSRSPLGSVCLMLLCSVFLVTLKETHSDAVKRQKIR